jgi:CelD/BcsL family acetyltransferase involved in cellulose biosynthesis
MLESVEELESFRQQWDALAVASASPTAAPGWLIPWWRHAAPEGTQLRTIVVLEGSELVGIAPHFANSGKRGRVDYRLLGSPISQRHSPLSKPGLEEQVAELVAGELANASPRPDVIALEAISATSQWPRLLATKYPGTIRPAVYERLVQDAPVITLGEASYDDWMAGKSSNFRQQMRRMRRQLIDQGGRVRLAEAGSKLDEDIDSMVRLHHSRFTDKGVTSDVTPGVVRMIRECAQELLPSGRFRLWMVELEDQPIGAGVFLEAGGEVTYWKGGLDDAHGRYKPAMQAILAAVEDGFERGDKRIDLGGGATDYKLRLADADDPVISTGLRPRGARYPLVWAQLLPADMRWHVRRAFRRLPRERQEALKTAAKRLHRR